MRKLRPAQHYFIDESGDLVLFDAAGRCIVGEPGVSRTFTLGAAWIKNPDALQSDLALLRLKLLNDGYFSGVPSFQPEARKTSLYFHAKDDLPEVRREVFQLLRAHEMHVIVAIRRKHVLADFAAHRFAETGAKITDHEVVSLRTERGISQWDVGDAAGLDHNYIGMIERGERNPAVVNVVKIAKALGVPPGELFRDFK